MVPPRIELGSQDSKSYVITPTPWDHKINFICNFIIYNNKEIKYKKENKYAC